MSNTLNTPAMAALRQRLAPPERKEPPMLQVPPPDPRPVDRRADRGRPRTPHTAHMRELDLPDGRKLLLDRRSIAFLCQGKPEEFGDGKVTIVAFKTLAKAVPVAASYDDLKAWWRADAPGKPQQPNTRAQAGR